MVISTTSTKSYASSRDCSSLGNLCRASKIQEVVINGRREKVLLEVTGLKQYFNVGRKDEVKAIDDISFHIYEGETFGLVGESGSGKSTTGRSVIRLYDPTAGEILFDGKTLAKLNQKRTCKHSVAMFK